MGERKPPTVYECPFLPGTEGIVCTAPVSEKQYNGYCREIPQGEKEPNYLSCPAYVQYMKAPIMTMRRLYSADMDVAFGHSRRRGSQGV